jgi:hypothetical protein
MAGSVTNEWHEPTDRRADPAAADRGADAAAGEKHGAEGAAQPAVHLRRPGHRRQLLLGAPRARRSIGVYLPGNWPAPFGIVLVVDHLSALMLVLTGSSASARCCSPARWDSAGASFHALFQIQLMGLYGAFLTADLFNLFVFFEVLLAASYGLLLHGSGARGCGRAALHRHQPASSLFLIGAAMLYGVTGTLNMADLALKMPLVPKPTAACCMPARRSWPWPSWPRPASGR